MNAFDVQLSSRQNSQTPQVDAEGYSIPPPGHDAQPWARSQGSESLMDEPGDMSTSSLSVASIELSCYQITNFHFKGRSWIFQAP